MFEIESDHTIRISQGDVLDLKIKLNLINDEGEQVEFSDTDYVVWGVKDKNGNEIIQQKVVNIESNIAWLHLSHDESKKLPVAKNHYWDWRIVYNAVFDDSGKIISGDVETPIYTQQFEVRKVATNV